MLTPKDIDHLANLARISVSEEEKVTLAKNLDMVLQYVSEISKVATGEVVHEAGALRNVMRQDENPHVGGEYSHAILANAPKTQDSYVKVEQIL